jgi:hypothetical protein
MLVTKALAFLLVPLALAAPATSGLTQEQQDSISDVSEVEQASFAALFHVVGDVVVGPGGYIQDGEWHAGEYQGGNANEKRIFGLTLALILKAAGGGWRYNRGGLLGGGGGGGGGDGGGPPGGPPYWGYNGCPNCY